MAKLCWLLEALLIRRDEIGGMTSTTPVEAMTVGEIRAELERLAARRNARGGVFHPAEYWRWRELIQIESSLERLLPL